MVDVYPHHPVVHQYHFKECQARWRSGKFYNFWQVTLRDCAGGLGNLARLCWQRVKRNAIARSSSLFLNPLNEMWVSSSLVELWQACAHPNLAPAQGSQAWPSAAGFDLSPPACFARSQWNAWFGLICDVCQDCQQPRRERGRAPGARWNIYYSLAMCWAI